MLAALKDEPLQSPWLLAGRAVAAGDFVRAADVFDAMGDASLEPFYRLARRRCWWPRAAAPMPASSYGRR